MNQIKPHQLWIGNAGDCRAIGGILDMDLRAVVQLAAEESLVHLPRDLVSCRFPLLDGTGNDADLMDLAVRCVANFVERRIPTLVCCGAGMSRSPAVVAAALSRVYHSSLKESLETVIEVTPRRCFAWILARGLQHGRRASGLNDLAKSWERGTP
jgi:protein-tyrosine phosphatase